MYVQVALCNNHTYIRLLNNLFTKKAKIYLDLSSDIYSAYGCYLETVTLSCPDNRTIFVTDADYGQFSYTCTQPDVTCCPPQTRDDCTQSVEESAPQDWAALKLLCDNQTSCDVFHQGGVLLDCPAPNEANYVRIYYQCLPGNKRIHHNRLLISVMT